MKKIKNNELRITDINKKVILYGWVKAYRNLGKKIFIDLRDQYGITQIIASKNLIKTIRKEYVLKVEGVVVKRMSSNSELLTGEIELLASEITVLAKAVDQLPFEINDNVKVKEKIRLKYRYLDLRRTKMQKNLWMRHNLNKAFREFLNSEEFMEIETPILSKSTPEGATDFLTEYKNNCFFALPQSPQVYKQFLMASGIQKYYQIARVFRNEDLRADRQLEFSQLDIEQSFVTEESIMLLVEKMFRFVMKNLNMDISENKFIRMNYQDAIDKYGNDRPDTRFANKLIDFKDNFANSGFKIFQAAESIKGVLINQELLKPHLKILELAAKQNKAKGIMWASLINNKKIGPGWKFLDKELTKIFYQDKSNAINKTLILVADEYEIACQAMGAVRIELNNIFKLSNKNQYNFLWIVNFPLFEKNDDKSISAMHHPFTSPLNKEMDTFDEKEKRFKVGSRSYDLVLNGVEIGGGSIRINNLEVQKRMFKVLGLNEKQIENQFGFFLEMFDKGLPPHGGIAFGIDRIAMILANETSIRELIAFPKNLSGIGVLEGTPTKNIGVNKNE